ncbi:MAG: 4-phosphopantoate--beta-alanine ligase [Candidatus Micrarchaeia archaeon]|jgi:4-phosphopantoate--beta-alanine ligase
MIPKKHRRSPHTAALPKTHPRYHSLSERHALEAGVKKGITHMQGLIAHGRGEAFDYLIGEKTTKEAQKAIRAASALLLSAKHAVISVNGNVAALSAKDIAKLANATRAKVEVNLFYRSEKRMRAIAKELKKYGVNAIISANKKIPKLASKRAKVASSGIWGADVVLVPLEDGDRTEALRAMGKKVIAVDLNPLSRTARKASITIVDNITRALPLMAREAAKLRKLSNAKLRRIPRFFNNKRNLKQSVQMIRRGV